MVFGPHDGAKMPGDKGEHTLKTSSSVAQNTTKLLKKSRKWMNKLESCWRNAARRSDDHMHQNASFSASVLLDVFRLEALESEKPTCPAHISSSSPDTEDGFLILNGESLFPWYSPYDIRKLLMSEKAIQEVESEERIIRSSPNLPFILVLRHLQTENFRVSFLVEVRAVSAVAKSNGASKEFKISLENDENEMASEAAASNSFLPESIEKRTVYVLPLPEDLRGKSIPGSSNSLGDTLFLIPCRPSLVLQHIGRHHFAPPVVGLPRDLHLYGKADLKKVESVHASTADPTITHLHEIVSIAIPQVPGLFILHNFLTQAEHDQILTEMHHRDSLKVEYLQHRRVAHFNRQFLYGVNQVGKEGEELNDIPTFFGWMQRRLYLQDDSIHISGPIPSSFGDRYCDQLTVNYYDYTSHNGDRVGQNIHSKRPGISPHVDSHSAFMDYIFVVSLASYTVMRFRRWDQSAEMAVPVYLPPCSLAIMSGEARYGWEHSIAEKRTDVLSETLPLFHRGDRLSLTWRVCRDAPHFKSSCAYPALCDGVEEKENTECTKK